MSDAVIITAMICATLLSIFWMGLKMNVVHDEGDDEIDG